MNGDRKKFWPRTVRLLVRKHSDGPAMLLDLEIRDFAIIDDLQIEFGQGLNALTGETGAGKSIIIDALGAVLGERVSVDMVRTGAKTAYVDARFQLDGLAGSPALREILGEHGVEAPNGELILSRVAVARRASMAALRRRRSSHRLGSFWSISMVKVTISLSCGPSRSSRFSIATHTWRTLAQSSQRSFVNGEVRNCGSMLWILGPATGRSGSTCCATK
jgi:energy-coupling factor transporter ATP-binding protein EcfA2